MSFTESYETAIHAKLAAIRESVHKLVLVKGIAVSHRLDQLHYLRLLEKLATWMTTNGFDRSEELAERERRIQGRVSSIDDPENSEIEVYFEPW